MSRRPSQQSEPATEPPLSASGELEAEEAMMDDGDDVGYGASDYYIISFRGT